VGNMLVLAAITGETKFLGFFIVNLLLGSMVGYYIARASALTGIMRVVLYRDCKGEAIVGFEAIDFNTLISK